MQTAERCEQRGGTVNLISRSESGRGAIDLKDRYARP
jgi:hypothetical protein